MPMKNKQGLAPIIATVILIALVMVVVVVIWSVISNMVRGKLGESEACFGVFEKVTLNPQYTCYDSDADELRFSINIGEIDVEEILVGISAEGIGESFKINGTSSAMANLIMWPSGSTDIVLPSKNAGLTYVFDMVGGGFTGAPDSISIAPIINQNQCSTSDSINEIDAC